jgi:hypothetical protein
MLNQWASRRGKSRIKTLNIEQSTLNIHFAGDWEIIGCSLFDVGGWMFPLKILFPFHPGGHL